MPGASARRFNDAEDYEQFMGPWSRAACGTFLGWLQAPREARWLDVGCGTGALTDTIAKMSGPADLFAVDPSPAQVRYAREHSSSGARFQVADAAALPFADRAFDVVAAALVLNFIGDKERAVREMRRVAAPGGIVAGFVWDFAAERSPSGPMRRAMRATGNEIPPAPGTHEATERGIAQLLAAAGFVEVTVSTFEVIVEFEQFEPYWRAQLPANSPTSRAVLALPQATQEVLREELRRMLAPRADGGFSQASGAITFRGRVPSG